MLFVVCVVVVSWTVSQCGWNVGWMLTTASRQVCCPLRRRDDHYAGTDTVNRLSICCRRRSLWSPVSVDSGGRCDTGLSSSLTLAMSIFSSPLCPPPSHNSWMATHEWQIICKNPHFSLTVAVNTVRQIDCDRFLQTIILVHARLSLNDFRRCAKMKCC